MPMEGKVCDGPPNALPFGEDDYLWWKWVTKSTDPCSTCAARNGKLSPVVLDKPHAFCTCDQVLRPRICTAGVSISSGTSTETIRLFVGTVPAHSSRTFGKNSSSTTSGSVSGSGVSVGGSSSSGSSDNTTVNNEGDTTMRVYEVWETITEERIDQYFCGGGLPDEITVTCTETRFVGFETESD